MLHNNNNDDDNDNNNLEINPEPNQPDFQESSTLKLKEAFFLLAKIQDTIAFLPATDRTQSANINVNQLHQLVLVLVTNIVTTMFKAERDKFIAIATELTSINASVLSTIMNVLTQNDILTIEEKIKTRARENICNDALPFAALQHRIIATRKEVKIKLSDLLIQRKYTNAEKDKIDACLANIDSNDNLFASDVTVNWSKQNIATINDFITELAKSFPTLSNISLVNRSFDEIQQVSDTIREYQLTAADYAMMQNIIELYTKNYPSQPYKPSVNAAIIASRQVRPIYPFDLQAILAFSHPLTARNRFLIGCYKSAGQPVYSVYDGLVSLCFGYEDLIVYFAKMVTQLQKDSQQPKIGDDTKQALLRYIADLEKYKSYFAKYFQIGMRFVMPLENYRNAFLKCEQQLQENPSITAFSLSMQELDQCIGILKQKTLAINLVMDIRVFCEDIDKLVSPALKTKLLRENVKNLFSNKFCSFEDGILITFKNYFNTLLGSRFVDNCTNLQAVFDQLNKIFADAGFDLIKQDALLKSNTLKPLEQPKLALIFSIYRKVEKRLVELQSDVRVEKRHLGIEHCKN